MAYLAYVIASLSGGILAALYWQQGNLWAAALAAAACVFFMARLFLTRTPRAGSAASGTPAAPAASDSAQARRELEEMLPHLRRNRNITRNAFAAGVVVGLVASAVNLPLGLAILGIAVVPGWLFWRNQQGVTMIERGLGR